MDMLQLSRVFIHKTDYEQALLYARQAYKTFKKAGSIGHSGVESALDFLQKISKAQGDLDELHVYTDMLSDFRKEKNKASTSDDVQLRARRESRQIKEQTDQSEVSAIPRSPTPYRIPSPTIPDRRSTLFRRQKTSPNISDRPPTPFRKPSPTISNRSAVSVSSVPYCPSIILSSSDVSANPSMESLPAITSVTSTEEKPQQQQKRRIIPALMKLASPIKQALTSRSQSVKSTTPSFKTKSAPSRSSSSSIFTTSFKTKPTPYKSTSTTASFKTKPAPTKPKSTTLFSKTKPTVSRRKKNTHSTRYRKIKNSEEHRQALKRGRALMWEGKFRKAERILQEEKDFWEWARGPGHKGAQAAARSLTALDDL